MTNTAPCGWLSCMLCAEVKWDEKLVPHDTVTALGLVLCG